MEWKPGIKPTIKTERLVLKILNPGDVTQEYIDWWNNDELQRGLGHLDRGWDLNRARKHVSAFDCIHGYHFGIYLKHDGQMIGFYTMTRDPRNKISTSTTLIGKKQFWRQGLAEEISRATINFRFQVMDIAKIEGKVRGDNVRSKALFEKLGFQKEGVLKSHSLNPAGGRLDITLFGMTREEWLARKKKGPAAT